VMNRVYLFASQEVRFLFQESRRPELTYSARRRKRPACNALVLRWASLNRSSEGVANARRLLPRAAFCATSPDRRLASSFQVLGKRTAACSTEQRFQMCVATNAWSEALTISLPQGIDASVASLLRDGAGCIAFAIVEAGSPILSPAPLATLWDWFLWHGTLISNCSGPERPIRIRIELRQGRLPPAHHSLEESGR